MTKKFSKLLCRAIIASVSFAMLLSTVPWACASALSENSIKQSAGTATGYIYLEGKAILNTPHILTQGSDIETLIPIGILLKSIGCEFESFSPQTENTFCFKGNEYVLTLAPLGIDQRKVPYEVSQMPLDNGKYYASIFLSRPYYNGVGLYSLSLEEILLSDDCSLLPGQNDPFAEYAYPYFTYAYVIENIIYFNSDAVELLLKCFGYQSEWSAEDSRLYVGKIQMEALDADAWAAIEVEMALQEGLLYSQDISYQGDITKLFFLELLDNAYQRIQNENLPQSLLIELINMFKFQDSDYLSRGEAFLIIDHLIQYQYPELLVEDAEMHSVFYPDEFSSIEEHDAAEQLHMLGILKGVGTVYSETVCAKPDKLLTCQEAICSIYRLLSWQRRDYSLSKMPNFFYTS